MESNASQVCQEMGALSKHRVNYSRSHHVHQIVNESHVMQMTGLDDHDIIFVRYVGQAKDRACLPYFIAVDSSTESVGELFERHRETHLVYESCTLWTKFMVPKPEQVTT